MEWRVNAKVAIRMGYGWVRASCVYGLWSGGFCCASQPRQVSMYDFRPAGLLFVVGVSECAEEMKEQPVLVALVVAVAVVGFRHSTRAETSHWSVAFNCGATQRQLWNKSELWTIDWQIWWQIHVRYIHICRWIGITYYIFSCTASVLPLRLPWIFKLFFVVLLIMCSNFAPTVSLQPLLAALCPPIHPTLTKRDPSSSRNPPIASTSQTQLAPKLNASQAVIPCLKLSGSVVMAPPLETYPVCVRSHPMANLSFRPSVPRTIVRRCMPRSMPVLLAISLAPSYHGMCTCERVSCLCSRETTSGVYRVRSKLMDGG